MPVYFCAVMHSFACGDYTFIVFWLCFPGRYHFPMLQTSGLFSSKGCWIHCGGGPTRKRKKNPNQHPTLSTPKQINNQSPALPPTLCSDPVLIQRGSSWINGQKCTYNGPISHTPTPPQRTPAEIEDATAQNCLVLLTLCKAASIYAATGSHQRRLNSGLWFLY